MERKTSSPREVTNEELHLCLQSRNEIIKDVREQIRKFAQEKGFAHDAIYDIQLAVNEAIANIIEHVYRGDGEGRIDVNAGIDASGNLVISIQDFGEMKTDGSQLRSRDLDDLREGGLGIFLLRNLMDEVDFDQSPEVGTRLVLKKVRQENKNSRGEQ